MSASGTRSAMPFPYATRIVDVHAVLLSCGVRRYGRSDVTGGELKCTTRMLCRCRWEELPSP